MLVTTIAYNLCTVNGNAIVLLTEYQKYYGEKLLYQRSTNAPEPFSDTAGTRHTVEISIPEGYSTDYTFISLGGTFQNVVRIDFWVSSIRANSSADIDHKYVVQVSDIQFYK